MSTIQYFNCPHCRQAFSLDDIMKSSIAHQLREESQEAVRKERDIANQILQEQLASKDKKIAEAQKTAEEAKRAKAAVERSAEELKAGLSDEAQRIAQEILAREKEKIEAQTKTRMEATMKDLEARIIVAEETSQQSIEQELALRVKLRESESAAKLAKVEIDRILDEEKLAAEHAGFKKASEEAKKQSEALLQRNSLLQAEISELQRIATMGSQQAQGERLELQTEAMLKSLFPIDDIREVQKFKNGADVIHRVMSPSGKCLGAIVWETKNAQSWKNEWVEKLKADTRAVNGQIGILLSGSLPKDCKGLETREGIIICDVRIAEAIAIAMRNQIIEVAQARAANEQKESMQATVYDYTQGPIFRRLEGIATPLKDLADGLTKDMAVADRSFAVRQMKIREMAKSLMGVYGDMQGLLGDAMPKIPMLEFESE